MFIPERSSAWGDVQVADALIGQTSVKYLFVLRRRKRTANRAYHSCLGVGGWEAREQTFEKSFYYCGLRKVVFDVNVNRYMYDIFIYLYLCITDNVKIDSSLWSSVCCISSAHSPPCTHLSGFQSPR